MADFLRTFHHDGKISTAGELGGGARTPTPFTLFTTTYNVAVFTPAERTDLLIPSISSLYPLFLLCDGRPASQSMQSAHLFSSRRNWDSPNPSPAGECAPFPFGSGGRGTLAGELGGGRVPNSDEGTYIVVLCKYTYFVACAFGLWRKWDEILKVWPGWSNSLQMAAGSLYIIPTVEGNLQTLSKKSQRWIILIGKVENLIKTSTYNWRIKKM